MFPTLCVDTVTNLRPRTPGIKHTRVAGDGLASFKQRPFAAL